jgi:hypothetical protein
MDADCSRTVDENRVRPNLTAVVQVQPADMTRIRAARRSQSTTHNRVDSESEVFGIRMGNVVCRWIHARGF